MENTKIFEAIMLICFGVAWPLSIVRLVKAKNSFGKSIPFLFVILTGYLSGILHKTFVHKDEVIYLYILNAIMVSVDIILTIKYRPQKLQK